MIYAIGMKYYEQMSTSHNFRDHNGSYVSEELLVYHDTITMAVPIVIWSGPIRAMAHTSDSEATFVEHCGVRNAVWPWHIHSSITWVIRTKVDGTTQESHVCV